MLGFGFYQLRQVKDWMWRFGVAAAVGALLVYTAVLWTDDAGWVRSCDQNRSLYCFSNVLTLFWDGFDITGDASRWSLSVP